VLSRTEEHEDAIATVVSRDAECVLARANYRVKQVMNRQAGNARN
jgi:hypothetical protein